MKIAKASDADLEMAMELASALEALSSCWGATMPEKIAKPQRDEDEAEGFSLANDEHCRRVCEYLIRLHKAPIVESFTVPSAPVPWWNRHYTLPTNGLKSTCFAVEHVTPDNCRPEYNILWHERNAVIDAQRQHDLIALRRFIRGAICGQEGTE